MNKLFLVLFTCFSFVFAADGEDSAINWNYRNQVELKKDELARYTLDIDDKIYNLDFRWTLFVNEGLVMLYKFNKFPYQNILYKDYKLKSFKIKLKNRAENAFYEPYALIVFEDFDTKTKKAKFTVLLMDEKRAIQAERVLPKAD